MENVIFEFIKERFPKYYWKSASKYSYSTSNYAKFETYEDFLNSQTQAIRLKTPSELKNILILIDIMRGGNIKFMNCDNMFPHKSIFLIFDADGSIIIGNEK